MPLSLQQVITRNMFYIARPISKKLLNHTEKKTIFPWFGKKRKSFVGYSTPTAEISENTFDRFEDVLVWTGGFSKLHSKMFLYFAIFYS